MARVVVATGYHRILDHLAQALRRHGHEVVGVLSAGGLPPMAAAVDRQGCPHFELPLIAGKLHIGRAMATDEAYATAVRGAMSGLAELQADFLVGWAIHVLPRFLLDSARHPINVHPSDLPRYRGGFPLEAQILNGDRRLYVTVHHTVPRIDAGAVLARSQPLKIKRSDTMTQLLGRSLPVGAGLVAGVLTHWDRLAPVQPPAITKDLPHAWGIRRVTDATGRVRNHGILGRLRIEWDIDSARDIARAGRAFDMIGGPFTNCGSHLFRITHAQTLESSVTAEPGQVFAVSEGTVDVQARDAVVRLTGRFADDEVRIAPGERFVSTEPIARLMPFPNAER